MTLHWYCHGDARCTALDDGEAMAGDSIIFHGTLPDEALIEVLRQSWFVVVPSGDLHESDDRRHIARLSLPSRIPYVLATSHSPILVLGDRMTGAARFVEQFGVGVAAPYERGAFLRAVESILQPETNLAMRRRAAELSGRFTDSGAADWLWDSLVYGAPADRRYEDLMPEEGVELEDLRLAQT